MKTVRKFYLNGKDITQDLVSVYEHETTTINGSKKIYSFWYEDESQYVTGTNDIVKIEEIELEKFKVGDKVKIVRPARGAGGCVGMSGVVVNHYDFTNGIKESDVFVRLDNGDVWGIGKYGYFTLKKIGPKFKIGDYAVEEPKDNNSGCTEYIKIISIRFYKGRFEYNYSDLNDGTYTYYNEDKLRKPTKEELELYFR